MTKRERKYHERTKFRKTMRLIYKYARYSIAGKDITDQVKPYLQFHSSHLTANNPF